MGIKDALKKLEDSVKEIPLLPEKSTKLRDENKRLIKLFSKYLKPKKKADGGDVKKDGKSRFIMPNADYDLNDPNFMRFIKRKMKKEGITQEEAIKNFKSDVVKHNKAKGNPGFINYNVGGDVPKEMRRTKNPDGGYTVYYNNNTFKTFDKNGKQIRSGGQITAPSTPKMKGKPFKKGGVVLASKGGSAHYKSKKSSKAIAKKYFKGIF